MHKKHIITLGGYPGSGKSTLRKLLANRLGYATFSTGDFMRALAIKEGHTLESFNELIATRKDIDEHIDAELARIEKEEDNMIIDSHLAYHFVPSGFSVFLDLSFDTAAERIYGDREAIVRKESGERLDSLEGVREATRKRVLNHIDRYKRHYGINPYDPSSYDLVVSSERNTPEALVETILTQYTTWSAL